MHPILNTSVFMKILTRDKILKSIISVYGIAFAILLWTSRGLAEAFLLAKLR
jgi:hypothetical protein